MRNRRADRLALAPEPIATGDIGRRAMLGTLGAGLVALTSRGLAAAPALNVRDFGATGDGRADDTAAIRRAQAAAGARGATLMFPAGTYAVTGWRDTGTDPVRWRSNEGATLFVRATHIQLFSPARPLQLRGLSRHGTTRLGIAPAAVAPGAILYVGARKVVERLRPDPIACQTALVTRTLPHAIELDRALSFDFADSDPGIDCHVYDRPRDVRLEGLRFVVADDNPVRAISLGGLRGAAAFDGCTFETQHRGDVSQAPDGAMILESVGVTARALTIRNCRYGYMLANGARDCTVTGVRSSGNRHPLYPSYWAQGCTFRNVRGTNNVATVDSHAAFDIAYEDVIALDDQEMSNIRSAGARLSDAHIRSREPRAFVVAFQYWETPYPDISGRHAVVFRNVRLENGGRVPPGMAGIEIGGGGRLVLDRVFTGPGSLPVTSPRGTPFREITITGGNVRLRRV